MKYFLLIIFIVVGMPKIQGQSFQTTLLYQEIQSLIKNEEISKVTTLVKTIPTDYQQDTILRSIYHDLGVGFYNETEDGQAIYWFKKEIEIAQLSYTTIHPIFFKPYLNIAESYFWGFEDFDKAIEYAQRALTTKSLSAIDKGRATTRLAAAYEGKGDFKAAEQQYLLAISAFQEVPDQDNIRDWLAQSYTGLAQIYSRQNQLTLALPYFHKAIQLFSTVQDEEGLNECYANLGIAFAETETPQFDSSFFYLQQSLKLVQSNDWIDLIASTNNTLGWVFNLQQKYQAALPYLSTALSLRQQELAVDYHLSYAEIYDNLGDAYRGINNLNKALGYYELAILNYLPQYRTATTIDLPDLKTMIIEGEKANFLIVLNSIAQTCFLKFQQTQQPTDLTATLDYFQLADQVIDLMRYEHIESQSKIFWRQVTRPIYEAALKAAFAAQRPDLAFYFMEKSKAVLLWDELRAKEAKQMAGLPDTFLITEKNLKKTLFFTEQHYLQTYQGTSKPSDLDSLQTAVQVAQQNYHDFIQQLEEAYPLYHQMKYGQSITALEDVQSTLSDGHDLMAFFTGDSLIFGLQLTSQKARLFQVNNAVLIHQVIPQLLTCLYQAALLDEKEELVAFDSLAHFTYQAIFRDDLLPQKQRTIIPDGILSYLPFQVLRPTKDQYLIEQLAIDYAYSGTILLMNKNARTAQKAGNDFLGIAPIYFDEELANLTHSLEEITAIQQIISGYALKETSATIEQFSQKAPHYKILHFSTHASAGNSAFPWIAFYGQEKLFLPNLYNLSLHADLVFLSACETNKGNFVYGEGMMNIGRGWAYAGVPSVVSTMWNINEQAGTAISVDFYKGLKKGLPQAVALQQSQLNYLNHHRNQMDGLATPHYWGAFIHIGDSTPLVFNETFSYLYLIVGGLLCVLLLGLYWWWKMRVNVK